MYVICTIISMYDIGRNTRYQLVAHTSRNTKKYVWFVVASALGSVVVKSPNGSILKKSIFRSVIGKSLIRIAVVKSPVGGKVVMAFIKSIFKVLYQEFSCTGFYGSGILVLYRTRSCISEA